MLLIYIIAPGIGDWHTCRRAAFQTTLVTEASGTPLQEAGCHQKQEQLQHFAVVWSQWKDQKRTTVLIFAQLLLWSDWKRSILQTVLRGPKCLHHWLQRPQRQKGWNKQHAIALPDFKLVSSILLIKINQIQSIDQVQASVILVACLFYQPHVSSHSWPPAVMQILLLENCP